MSNNKGEMLEFLSNAFDGEIDEFIIIAKSNIKMCTSVEMDAHNCIAVLDILKHKIIAGLLDEETIMEGGDE